MMTELDNKDISDANFADENIPQSEVQNIPDTPAETDPYADSDIQTVKADNDSTSTSDDVLKLCIDFPDMRARELCAATSDRRYAELRAMGLTPREAFLATAKPGKEDNRSHLLTGVPSGAHIHSAGMTSWEMNTARAIFSDLPESEIKRLYTKVTSQHN